MGILNDKELALAEVASENGLLEKGTYICRIVGVERWKNDTSLVWKFRIEPGQASAGREVYDWTGLSAKGIWKTKERFEILGVDIRGDEEALLGMLVKVYLELGTNEATGAPKNKVTAVERLDAALVNEAQDKLDAVVVDSDIPF